MLGVIALVLIACGGGASSSEQGSSERTSPSEGTPGVASSPAAEPPTVVALAPRTDGLTGATLPATTAQSREFDEEHFDSRVGAFPPLNDVVPVLAADATWMEPDELVLGAVHNGEARAYPLFMMTLHHVSNDTLGGEPYLVTF